MPKKLFQKGNTAAVGKGRPIINEELVQACRKRTLDSLKIVDKILRGGPGIKKADQRWAIEWMADRGYGKAIQPSRELQANESYADFLRTLMADEKKEDTKK